MFLIPQEYIEIKKTKMRGKGVFAKKVIEAGTIIGDYIGYMIRTSEESDYEEKYGFYAMYYSERASIFPDMKEDGIHRINHSCAPNCYISSYQGHTLYFALRKIFPGEELTVSYMVNPLDKDCSPCDHQCRCGSVLCTNSMHSTPKLYDAWAAYDEKNTKGFESPRAKYGKKLALLSAYPQNLPDSAVYPLFGSEQAPVLSLPDRKLPAVSKLRETIRQNGQRLLFKNLGITIVGISDNHIIAASEK